MTFTKRIGFTLEIDRKEDLKMETNRRIRAQTEVDFGAAFGVAVSKSMKAEVSPL